MKVAWMTIRNIGAKAKYISGMTSILHTFGSDIRLTGAALSSIKANDLALKERNCKRRLAARYSHYLSLFFGGMSKSGAWIYPKDKHKLDKYRSICASYKAIFIKELRTLHKTGKINFHNDFEVLIAEVEKIRWVVHSTRPTMETKIIEDYLAKYINRIAVSNKRLDYIKDSEKVILLHNDYTNQQAGQVAPKAYKIMEPLVAIDQILQHVLPPYFQKSRSYGIHNHSSKLKTNLTDAVKRNGQTIRTVFEIITELMKLHPYKCEKCGSDSHFIEEIKPNKSWILTYINIPTPRPPPQFNSLQKPIPR